MTSASLQQFQQDLAFKRLQSAYDVTKTTVILLRSIISETKGREHSDFLLRLIKHKVSPLVSCDDTNSVLLIRNIVRRVLKVIREEYSINSEGDGISSVPLEKPSLERLFSRDASHSDRSEEFDDHTVRSQKSNVLQAVDEILLELESAGENIASQALDHIHADELILTAGRSRTVELFLKKASEERKFEVFVAETAPKLQGHDQAAALSSAGIQTTVIPDATASVLMSRVNKIIMGTDAVLADGGIKSFAGAHTIAVAAKYYNVPVIILAGQHKISPEYNQETSNRMGNPAEVLPYSLSSHRSRTAQLEICNPTHDYVPPTLITLFISNIGGYAPSYVYRLLSELYHPDDRDLSFTAQTDDACL